MEKMKNVIATVTTKKQSSICFFYCDSFKQDCIDFIRDISRLHDNVDSYRVTVKMYSDINDLYDMSEVLTDDILSVISFISMCINKFLRG